SRKGASSKCQARRTQAQANRRNWRSLATVRAWSSRAAGSVLASHSDSIMAEPLLGAALGPAQGGTEEVSSWRLRPLAVAARLGELQDALLGKLLRSQQRPLSLHRQHLLLSNQIELPRLLGGQARADVRLALAE